MGERRKERSKRGEKGLGRGRRPGHVLWSKTQRKTALLFFYLANPSSAPAVRRHFSTRHYPHLFADTSWVSGAAVTLPSG